MKHGPESQKTILIVDDEASFKEALADLLEMEGYKTITASDGNSALKILQDHHVDVVLSDIRMPNGDGIELLDKVKENHINAPLLLMMTGFSELPLEDAYNKGAEALFSKPIDTESLVSVIERLLGTTDSKWTQAGDQVNVEMMVSLQFANLSEALDAKVVSLGRGGMFVAIDAKHFPKVNDAVDFKITPSNGSPILEGSGIVRWARSNGTTEYPTGCGFEFIFLPESHRNSILSIINATLPRAYIPNK